MDSETITGKLKQHFGEGIIQADETSGMLTVIVPAGIIHPLVRYLKEDLGFVFLTDLTGVHYPEKELPFAVVYHLHNLADRIRIRIRTFLPEEDPLIPSVTDLFSAANWMERETYDFYGILFQGHPNLKRILNVEYLDYFPMRKEYPLEDQEREDKDDRFFGR
jgi:NADH-quinone oxidoreductase subunit C